MFQHDPLRELFNAVTSADMVNQMKHSQPKVEFAITKQHASHLINTHNAHPLKDGTWEIRVTPRVRSILKYKPETDTYTLSPCVKEDEAGDGRSYFADFLNRINEHYTFEKRFRLYKYYMRIHDDAKNLLVTDTEFERKFMETDSFNAVILSADIRDSSALVNLEGNEQKFPEFIARIIEELSECVCRNFGIYDKFTGDGILAFFPDFYSEENAVIHALNCAEECHKLYSKIYSEYKEYFGVAEHGLGVGISYGKVWQSGTQTEFTTVGKPVVTACRLSGAESGHTYVCEDTWKEICRLKHDSLFNMASDKKSFNSKGRDYPMKDICPVSIKELNNLAGKVKPSWCISQM